MTVIEVASSPSQVGPPQWLMGTLDVKEGRDPLGLQTTTQDRLTPVLLPGIFELSRQARYFSFYCWLLDLYRERHGKADRESLSRFIKQREWDYGLAVLTCPHTCDSVPVGALRLRPVVAQPPPYPRRESVESVNGGYGLYYRTPLAEFGVVARAGTMLGDTPIPIDVLCDNYRARALASSFAAGVAHTDYVKRWMFTADDIPLEVLIDYARAGCLCQLTAHPVERDAIHEAVFGEPIAAEVGARTEPAEMGTALVPPDLAPRQRRRSFAHFLTLVETHPDVVHDPALYRESLWSPPVAGSQAQAEVAGQWAALIAKDVWQEALCSVWAEFTQAGLKATYESKGPGLSWDEVSDVARGMTAGPPQLDGTAPTQQIVAAIANDAITLPGLPESRLVDAPLEQLREATQTLNTATSGLVVFLELRRRANFRSGLGWEECSHIASAWQPSVADVLATLSDHLGTGPAVADTLWWLVNQYIFDVHERIAYSKLPDNTFRFRWQEGRVRFYNNGVGRFPLAAIRQEPLSQLSGDLGFWERDAAGTARLTNRGQTFVEDAFR